MATDSVEKETITVHANTTEVIAPSPTFKRRQSDSQEDFPSSKRAKLSPEADQTGIVGSSNKAELPLRGDDQKSPAPRDVIPARHKTQVDEDRKRGKRMLGALLGTLSSSSRGPSLKSAKQRADVEKRASEKLKQIDDDINLQENKRRAHLKKSRKDEQWHVDLAALSQKHQNLLARARFLVTEAEPKVYYKPYKLSVEQEVRIQRQIEELEAKIEHEKLEFGRRRNDVLDVRDDDNEITLAEKDKMEDHPAKLPKISDIEDEPPETSSKLDNKPRDDDENDRETVIEAEEDTVIF